MKPAMLWLPLILLRPTQITVGLIYVAVKIDIMRRMEDGARKRFMEKHAIKCARAADGSLHIVDHHHWARAWHDCGIEKVPVEIVAHLPTDCSNGIWAALAERSWLHPYDEFGRRRDASELPVTVGLMRDDPYQSLAALTRRAGAYRKAHATCSSFIWTDFIRGAVQLEGSDTVAFTSALLASIKAARSDAARALPGFIGNRDQ
ncbi:hypothetical protein B2G74_03500 [Burkholderia sp. A27]|jgi:hypothetical protein|nr:hypothetical protein B2G74_03500 [Burkholderia sp. A27]